MRRMYEIRALIKTCAIVKIATVYGSQTSTEEALRNFGKVFLQHFYGSRAFLQKDWSIFFQKSINFSTSTFKKNKNCHANVNGLV